MLPPAVEGFLFSPDRRRVVMVRKNRPVYLAGQLIGVGGKLEPGEGPFEAMIREFVEETGVLFSEWELFARYTTEQGRLVYLFRGFGPVDDVRTITDEPIEIVRAGDLPPDVCQSIRWAVPLALDDLMMTGQRQLIVQRAEGARGQSDYHN